jgi:hypothetical protein
MEDGILLYLGRESREKRKGGGFDFVMEAFKKVSSVTRSWKGRRAFWRKKGFEG